MKIKVCRKCDLVLTVNNSYKHSGNICKECEKQRMKEYRENFPDKRKETKDKWNKNNPDKVKGYRKSYRKNNHEKYREIKKNAHKNRKKNDPFYKFTCSMRDKLKRRMNKKFGSKDSNFYRIIGMTPPVLREYIQKQFKDGMSWENYGSDTWHLDHIIPLSTAKNKEEYYKLWHYTNLQPLWAEENIRKSNKIL